MKGDEEKAADQIARWMENPEESLRVLRECLLSEIRKCDELVRQRDEARLSERQRCMAALCQSCAEGIDATIGFPGDEKAGYPPEFWHRAGLLAVPCRAARLRAHRPATPNHRSAGGTDGLR